MDRWDWMVVRAFAPALGGFVITLVSAGVVRVLQGHAVLSGLADAAKWVPVATLAVTGLYVAWTSYRLWEAHNGEGPLCHCGGLLGIEHEGRGGRGGAYRRCYACGNNINHRHY